MKVYLSRMNILIKTCFTINERNTIILEMTLKNCTDTSSVDWVAFNLSFVGSKFAFCRED